MFKNSPLAFLQFLFTCEYYRAHCSPFNLYCHLLKWFAFLEASQASRAVKDCFHIDIIVKPFFVLLCNPFNSKIM